VFILNTTDLGTLVSKPETVVYEPKYLKGKRGQEIAKDKQDIKEIRNVVTVT
jgi:hypothetical protein